MYIFPSAWYTRCPNSTEGTFVCSRDRCQNQNLMADHAENTLDSDRNAEGKHQDEATGQRMAMEDASEKAKDIEADNDSAQADPKLVEQESLGEANEMKRVGDAADSAEAQSPESSHAEDSHFKVGKTVLVKVQGYPWWPAMVISCPYAQTLIRISSSLLTTFRKMQSSRSRIRKYGKMVRGLFSSPCNFSAMRNSICHQKLYGANHLQSMGKEERHETFVEKRCPSLVRLWKEVSYKRPETSLFGSC